MVARYSCRTLQALLLACSGWFSPLPAVQAALIVNPARPLTHLVDVQIIQTTQTSGTPLATVFGNASQRASIEAAVDTIWAQAGIDINFLPSITTYSNTFAYQGNTAPNEVRPSNDLYSIINSATASGITHSDSKVINMFFVEISPGHTQLGEFSVSGIARIGANGIVVYVGDSLLGNQMNREVVAGVVAHEIGHNLGLEHTAPNLANLMSSGGTSDQLTQQQIDRIFQIGTFFLQPVSPAADFTGDGIVNGADLIAWRGAYAVNANGDADGDGDSDGKDFLTWQRQFGSSSGTPATGFAIPEPGIGFLFLVGIGLLVWPQVRYCKSSAEPENLA